MLFVTWYVAKYFNFICKHMTDFNYNDQYFFLSIRSNHKAVQVSIWLFLQDPTYRGPPWPLQGLHTQLDEDRASYHCHLLCVWAAETRYWHGSSISVIRCSISYSRETSVIIVNGIDRTLEMTFNAQTNVGTSNFASGITSDTQKIAFTVQYLKSDCDHMRWCNDVVFWD